MPAGHDISSSGDEILVRSVQADTTRSSTTAAAQPDLTIPLGLGSYLFKWIPMVQSAATTTGHKFSVNFTGTKGIFGYWVEWSTAATTASDDVPDQDHVAAPGGVMSVFSARTPTNAGTGATTDIDTINADVMYRVQGAISVTVAGNLEFCWAPEAAANATLKAGSSVILWKTG